MSVHIGAQAMEGGREGGGTSCDPQESSLNLLYKVGVL